MWLFNEDLPELPNPRGVSVEDRQKDVAEARQKVVTTKLQQQGLDGLLVLARRAKQPWEIGLSLAGIVTDPQIERDLLERTLAAGERNERMLGRGYVVRRYGLKGREWSDGLLKSHVFTSWPPAKQADFCLGLPEEPSTWQLASNLGLAVEEAYWAEAHVFLSRLKSGVDAEFAIEKLLGFRRALYAFDQAALQPAKLSDNTLIKILEGALRELAEADKISPSGGFAWSLGRIFEKLRVRSEIPDAVLGRLEWQ